MTANRQYRRIFLRTYQGLRDRRHFIYKDATARFSKLHDDERKKRRPKGKAGKTYQLPEDVVTELRERFADEVAEYTRLDALLDEARKRNNERLFDLADAVEIIPTENYYKVKVGSSYSYNSQGYGKETYARGELIPLEASLKAAGLDTHISRVVRYRDDTAKFSCDREAADFWLWVNCEPYVADAVNRRITIAQACELWKAKQINPFVYNPFLPHHLGSF